MKKSYLVLGAVIECVIGLLAYLITVLIDDSFNLRPEFNASHIFWGVIFSIPPILFAIFATSNKGLNNGPLAKIHETLKPILRIPLSQTHWTQILVLALLVGIGEEILFRGILQNYAGIVIASAIFGLLHALTGAYLIIATIMGFYLGLIYHFFPDISVPIAVHFIYDAVALILYKRSFNQVLDEP
jgi:uncharacterized protein